MHFYVSRTIRWYVIAEVTFIRESIQGDEQTIATFPTTPEIIAEVSTYDPRELLVSLFNQVTNSLSVGSRWRFDSIHSLAISLCAFRPTIGAGPFIDTLKSLYSKDVLNIQNLRNDYCFLWSILSHIHRVDKHAIRTSKYEPFMNELNTTGLQFPLKFSDRTKFENLNPTISVNVLVYENNEVFPLNAFKHRDRIHHINLLMISKNEVPLPARQEFVHSRRQSH